MEIKWNHFFKYSIDGTNGKKQDGKLNQNHLDNYIKNKWCNQDPTMCHHLQVTTFKIDSDHVTLFYLAYMQ